MIIPWLRGIFSWHLTPVTWVIVATNALIYFSSVDPKVSTSLFDRSSEVVQVGQMYYQFKNHGKTHLQIDITENEWLLLGAEALRSPEFMGEAGRFQFSGDQVQINSLKSKLAEFHFYLASRYTHVFGLSVDSQNWLSWITYQFTHAGLFHLVGNMLMLIVFGSIIELKMGGLVLIVIYLLGGIAGGVGFFSLGSASLVPVVGASGSISALMAFYTASEVKRRVSFIYFLAPLEGFVGLIYLPTWMLYPLCFLPDLAGYLSTPGELGGGVAYAAHLGGISFGLATGLYWRRYLRSHENRTDRVYLANRLEFLNAEEALKDS